ncbi:MAG TPA: SRPBCC domain-containing protein [Vicinamibacterales bacterium]|jgi:uncharacterized protein YndB with AHSA1/START domain
MNPTRAAADPITEEIIVNASAERVFDAFVRPSERVTWWNVEGRFHTTHMDSDLRPGGKWIMRGTRGDGGPFSVQGEYRVVDRPRLLVFTWRPDWQGDATQSEVRIELTERDGATHVRLTHSGLTTEISRQSHRGWPQILALMQKYVDRH